MSKDKENYFIDFLRFIAAFAIMFYHSWSLASSDAINDAFFRTGYLAVNFYFLVTGYLMMNSLNKRNDKPIDFMKNKIKRLLPGVILAFFISYAFTFGHKGLSLIKFLSNDTMGDLFFLNTLGVGNTINSAWWYMSAMLFACAILYPLIKKYKDDFVNYYSFIIIAIILAIVKYFDISFSWHSKITLIFANGIFKAFIYILLGCYCYNLSKKISQIKLNKTKRVVLTIIEFITYIALFYNMWHFYMGTILFAILFTLVLALSFSKITYSSSIFKHKINKKLGNFGFYLYLVHEPVRTYLIRITENRIYLKLLPKYLIISLSLALFMYITLEFIYPKLLQKKH